MVKPKRNKSESGLGGKGNRYWSIMLVGEHGRVIPFRHFKAIAIAVIALACLSLAALAVIGYLYAQQVATIAGLQREVDGLRRQTIQLRDEKDVLQAKLVIYEMQKVPEAAQSPKIKEVARDAPKPAASIAPTPIVQESRPPAAASPQAPPTAAPTPTSTPSVNWVVELQRFAADFDARRELIRFTIRIVNKTAKHAFSGRVVLVIRQAGASHNSWVSLPSVPLVQGKPTGKSGQAFTVQNYRTMDFKLYKQRLPIFYDTATVFVFLSSGELLLSQDFNFKIEVQTTPTPAPTMEAAPTPAPTKDITPSIPADTPSAPPVSEPTAGGTGDSGARNLPGAGALSGPGGTPVPSDGPAQGPVAPAPSPPISPAPVPEKSPEVAPNR